jgi:signal transduction histidine kinase
MITLHSRFLSLFLTAFTSLALAGILPAVAAPVSSKEAVSDSLRKELAECTEMQDRVRLIHDLIDLSSSSQQIIAYNRMLLRTADKLGDEHLQLEALRNLANNIQDSIPKFISEAEKLPVNDEQKEVLAYLRYSNTLWTLNYSDEKAKSELLMKLIGDYRNGVDSRDDIYLQTGRLFCLCAVFSKISTGKLYSDYLSELDTLVSRLPQDGRQILPNVFYVLSANYYSGKGLHKEALRADSILLSMVPALERRYSEEGRKYRSLSQFKYVSYRRMLLYSDVLSRKEIENVYSKIHALAAVDPNLASELNSPLSITRIRYFMATGKYAEAIPMLDGVIASSDKSMAWARDECLKDRITAGTALGSQDHDFSKYSLMYIELLNREKEADIADKAKELQVVYDTNRLEQELATLKLNNARSRTRQACLLALISLAALVAVVLLLFRNRKLKMAAEESSMIKSAFIRNINHEIRTPLNSIVGFSKLIAESGEEMDAIDLARYDSIIESNCDSMLQMVDNLLSVSDLESGEMKFTHSPCSLKDLCTTVIDKSHYSLSPGVRMSFVPKENDTVISTDSQRVSQVLSQFLTNACKFTKQGGITLDYSLSNAPGKVVFSVTDTGIGIPADKAGVIFGQFEKVDDFTQGTGIGLSMCSLIAKRLGGKISLDTSYTGGARFLLTIPAEA